MTGLKSKRSFLLKLLTSSLLVLPPGKPRRDIISQSSGTYLCGSVFDFPDLEITEEQGISVTRRRTMEKCWSCACITEEVSFEW